MLIDMMSGKKVEKIPFKDQYDLYLSRMDQREIDGVFERLNEMIDEDEIHTAGWMPGGDWTDTPFDPIYRKAAKRNYDVAAKCFGLMVYATFMDHPETWSSGRFEKDGRDIGSRTYFRVRDR